jgi:uncharacterized protein
MKTQGILAYLAIVFGLAWGIWGALLGKGIYGTNPLFHWLSLPAVFAPALAGLVVRRWITHEGFADIRYRLHWKINWPYYLFAWLSPLVVTAVIVLLAMGFGLSQPDFSLHRFFKAYAPTATIPSLPFPIFPTAILATMIQAFPVALLNWGEEFGWRGYLQMRLFADQPLKAAIATGLIWGIWHYPLILLGYQRYENLWWGLLQFPVFTILLSIIFGWLQRRTGSLWSVCLAHGATNAIGGSLTSMLFLGGSNWLFVNYAGFLGWLPLGILSLWIIVIHKNL